MVTLRPATISDWPMLLEWRNDPVTRLASINTDMVTREMHLAWLESCLADPRRKLYVAERNGLGAGTIRFDKLEEGWEISWTVAPAQRGAGLGSQIVRAGVALMAGPLVARIKPENQRSRRIAERAGFVQIGEADGLTVWRR